MTDWSTLSEDEKVQILNSLTSIGPNKAVGYLPLYTIKDILQLQPEKLAQEAENRGLNAVIIGTARVKSGALYVYHRGALCGILREFKGTSVSAGVISDPDEFIELIAHKWFEPDHPFYPLIASAFNEGSFGKAT